MNGSAWRFDVTVSSLRIHLMRPARYFMFYSAPHFVHGRANELDNPWRVTIYLTFLVVFVGLSCTSCRPLQERQLTDEPTFTGHRPALKAIMAVHGYFPSSQSIQLALCLAKHWNPSTIYG